MRSLLLTAAFASIVTGAPGGPPFHWNEHSHPGWPNSEVYTPPGPKETWTQTYGSYGPYGPPSSYPQYPSPTPTVTTAPSASSPSVAGSSAAANPTQSPPANNACASVSRLVKSFSKANADPEATPTVPADIAYECINSVPFKSAPAVQLMDSIRPYLDWQTTTQYIEDPPAEYAQKIQPAYDFSGEFERIYDSAKANSYANEYQFGFDLYRLFQRAHDGHFVYYPDSVTLIFSFARTTPLVSVSLDGESIPEVYVYSDVLASSFGDAGFSPSPIVQIDGQDATEFLLNWSEYGSLQDRDALWNNMFYLLAQVSLGPYGTGTGTFSGGGRGRWIYPGPSTTLTFANGSSVTNQNYANVLAPFDGIQSGADVYEKYFTPPRGEPEPASALATVISSSSSAAASSSSSSSSTIPAPGYPSPFIREKNNMNSGYFLKGEDYDDVAVLSVPSFVGETTDELPFQSVNTYLINEAVAKGKKKLIVDVSANGGGTILQGFDLFLQLFPQILPYSASRYRAHEAFDLIGEEISWYSGQFPRTLNLNSSVLNIISSSFNYRTDVDVNYQNFDSWEEKYGPHAFGPEPDNYTSLLRWNLSDVLTPINSGGIYVSGYLERDNITVQPFAPENIVVVYDGYCASTCTIFSELMRQQGGVKTIALGGRPNKDIIQAVGGVKGTNDLPYSAVLYYVEKPFQIQHYHDTKYYAQTALGEYNDLPLYRGTNYVINARDGIRQGDDSETPLQFVYEPADCRIYYTPEMAVDQSAAWKTVADTAFNGINHCVAGDYGGKYSGSYGSEKRSADIRPKHAVSDIDISEHYRAMAEVWTGRGGMVLNGDSLMPI